MLYDRIFKDIRLADLQHVVDTYGKNYPTLKKLKGLFNQLYEYAMKNDVCNKDYSEYHYAVMDLRLNPGAVRLLQASCRSGLSTVLAFTADVAPHHRFVPDECVFGCQGALLSLLL